LFVIPGLREAQNPESSFDGVQSKLDSRIAAAPRPE